MVKLSVLWSKRAIPPPTVPTQTCPLTSSVIDHTRSAGSEPGQPWQAGVRDLTDGRGVDVLLDMVAGPYTQKNLDSMARDGRCSIIAFLLGSKVELDLRVVLAKRLTITGSTLRPQTVTEKARIAADLERSVLPLLESGRVRPIIHQTFPLDAAAAAHELMESSRHMGKIVLTTSETGREVVTHD